MTRMHNPPHPGESLLEDVLPALGITVTGAAEQLGVSRVQLSRVLHGHSLRLLGRCVKKHELCAAPITYPHAHNRYYYHNVI